MLKIQSDIIMPLFIYQLIILKGFWGFGVLGFWECEDLVRKKNKQVVLVGLW